MTRGTIRTLATATAAAVILSGAVLDRRTAVIDDIAALSSTSAQLSSSLASTEYARTKLRTVLDEQKAIVATGIELLDARKPFLASVTAFGKALQSAKSKVNTAPQLARVTAAQKLVLAERLQPDVVVSATSTVTIATKEVSTAVAAYDAEQRRIAAAAAAAGRDGGGGSWSSAVPASTDGGSALNRARAALNQVGGGHVPLKLYSGSCQGTYSDACSLSSGYIAVTNAIGSYSQGRLLWAMAHELAHQYQFGAWGALQRSAKFGSLFGGNFEKLANCMAATRGYGSSNVSCSADQLNYARGVWSRNIG